MLRSVGGDAGCPDAVDGCEAALGSGPIGGFRFLIVFLVRLADVSNLRWTRGLTVALGHERINSA